MCAKRQEDTRRHLTGDTLMAQEQRNAQPVDDWFEYKRLVLAALEQFARQNEMLNMQPENYNGLESVFTDSRPLRDQMIWGR